MLWRRVVFGGSILLNLTLLYTLIWGAQGLIAYDALKAQYTAVKEQVAELDSRNIALSREIRLLQSDAGYIEKMIRNRMNFVKKDEILYVFPTGTRQDALGAAPDERKD